MSFWDQQYSVDGYKYGTDANAFLREQAARLLAPGQRVLVPGDGEGRNGVWLAGQGLRVTSVDSSAVGLRKAGELAATRRVTLLTLLADLAEWTPEPGAYDALVLTYVHFPPAIRSAIHRRLLGGLATGGVLILEAFHPTQLGRSSGGPKDITMLYTLDMLRDDLAGVPDATFEELEAWEGETALDEGPGHRGAAKVTRIVARRR